MVEFLDVIEPLRDPRRHGGDPADAFHVVCPTLPGYGFSDKPTVPGWGVEAVADAWARLMTALGYDRFGAQGGDWGSAVTSCLGVQHHPDRCVGIHLNMVIGGPGRDDGEPTPAEQAALGVAGPLPASGTAATPSSRRPGRRRVGYGLVDSPVGPGGVDPREVLVVGRPRRAPRGRAAPRATARQRDALLAARGRRLVGPAVLGELHAGRAPAAVEVPAGMSIFPKEIFRPSRRWAERRFTDIRHWNELAKGGHFAAFEQPAIFVDEVRAAFRAMR